jgi:hypothetical protein
MSKLQTICPHCGSDHVRLINTDPIFIPNPEVTSNEKELYQWDEEIYAKAICDNCGTTLSFQGTINWNV